MTIVLTGGDLGLDDLVAAVRRGEPVSIADEAVARMRAARQVVERVLARGDEVYGLTTGVGAGKTDPIEPADAAARQWAIVRSHIVGLGPALPAEVVRTAALVVANAFTAGWAGVRPELAARYVEALNDGHLPEVHSLGSIGQADLAPLAELAMSVLDGVDLAPGEGLAVLSSNAFSTGRAALGVVDTCALLDALDLAGAMSLEAFGANLGMLHPAIAESRPSAGLRTSLQRLRTHLEGSGLWEPDSPRNLQDPLTFRSLPQVHGTARDAHAHALAQVQIELNAPQNNPLVLLDEDRLVSVASFDAQALATALDVARIGLAPALFASSERTVKLLDTMWSGLPRGLVDGPADGLSFLAISAQSLAAEAALLAAPVSFQPAGTAHAEGIEDRTALAPLAARRLDEMLDLGARAVAIELVVATRAIDLRGSPVGAGLRSFHDEIRARVPATTEADIPDLERVAMLVREGLRTTPLDSVERDT
jgi:histidine ammonia-lyase